MPLISAGPDLWTATTLSSLGALKLPTRMTIARLSSGGLWLWSPLAADDGLADEVARLGPVEHLVGPSCLHHLHLGAWAARFPAARVWGAPGLAEKRPDLTFAGTLGDEAPEAWRGVLDQHVLRGIPRINETVFFHRAARALLCADLVFHVRPPMPFLTGLTLSLMGTRGRFAMSRAWRLFFTKDRAAFRGSLERVLSWDIAAVLPGHGEPQTEDAREALRTALRWGLAK